MNYFLRFGAYVLHPLLMPLIGALTYYIITPRFIDSDIIRAKLFAIAIITIFVPIVIFLLLKNLGWISSMELKNVNERKIPLMLQCILLLLIIKVVYNPYESPEMYFFFVGILFSSISALILVLFKLKVSLHPAMILKKNVQERGGPPGLIKRAALPPSCTFFLIYKICSVQSGDTRLCIMTRRVVV